MTVFGGVPEWLNRAGFENRSARGSGSVGSNPTPSSNGDLQMLAILGPLLGILTSLFGGISGGVLAVLESLAGSLGVRFICWTLRGPDHHRQRGSGSRHRSRQGRDWGG